MRRYFHHLHVLIVASCLSVALLAGWLLPAVAFDSVTPGQTVLFVLLFFLLALMGHQIFRLHLGLSRLTAELGGVCVSAADARQLVERNEAMVQELRQGLTQQMAQNSIRENEYRHLRGLLNQLGRKTADADPATPGAPGQISPGVLVELLRDAVGNNRIEVYLQKIVTLPRRKIHGFECYSRIITAEGSELSPSCYLETAIESGIIGGIDAVILFHIVQILKNFRIRRKNISFFVNISPYTFASDEHRPELLDFLGGNRELTDGLVLELPVSFLSERESGVPAAIRKLTAMGFALSLDQCNSVGDLDIGKMQLLGVRFLKVDAATLLREGDGLAEGNPVSKLQQALARANITLIADKVESEAMVAELLDYDIGMGEGYVFGSPRRAWAREDDRDQD